MQVPHDRNAGAGEARENVGLDAVGVDDVGAGAAEGAALAGSLLYDDAPYGVGYVVASWS